MTQILKHHHRIITLSRMASEMGIVLNEPSTIIKQRLHSLTNSSTTTLESIIDSLNTNCQQKHALWEDLNNICNCKDFDGVDNGDSTIANLSHDDSINGGCGFKVSVGNTVEIIDDDCTYSPTNPFCAATIVSLLKLKFKSGDTLTSSVFVVVRDLKSIGDYNNYTYPEFSDTNCYSILPLDKVKRRIFLVPSLENPKVLLDVSTIVVADDEKFHALHITY
eukprot:TRINITY_DN149280_c0_g1_i1.p1 TRINITY_DN149280_c0_g1~~TRINITY_DN149280_c0_g1_i1.p1  ORF type:complete len:221 (+),score=40.00 TRINITY_DN149280_c0_g1_i1:121-783(+)